MMRMRWGFSGLLFISMALLLGRAPVSGDPRNPVETTKYLPAYTMFSNCILLKMLGVPVTLKDISGAPTYLSKWASQYSSKADLLTANHMARFTLTREEIIKVSNWVQSNL